MLEEDDRRLAKLVHPLVGPPTCSVGLIEGGSQINIVPDRCQITVDRRLVPGEKADQVLDEYRELLDVEIDEPFLVDEAMETPADAQVVQIASQVLSELGGEPEPIGVPFGCDATKLSRAGIPSIIFGPGSIDQAHRAEEFVEIEQVEFAAEFYKQLILRFD